MRLITFFLFLFQMLKIESCTEKTETVPEIEKAVLGDYVLKSRFLGDAVDSPCGWEANFKEDITLSIKKAEDGKGFTLNGKLPVNTYFGKIEIGSEINKLNIYNLKISNLGGTKVGGPKAFMDCESNLIDFMTAAPEIKADSEGVYIGTFKKDDKPSRDGGTYLIFERKSKL